MNKEAMISAINSKFEDLKTAIEGDNLEMIRELTLDLHAMVHPAVISEKDELALWAKAINVEELRNYMIEVGKNTRRIISKLTLEQIKSMVPEEWVMRILEEGGVTTDFRSVCFRVF